MKKHILKMIWNQRRVNVWIFSELLVVVCALWVMLDLFTVDTCVARQPEGVDISDTYWMIFGLRSPSHPGYVPDSLIHGSEGELLLDLMHRVEQMPQIEATALAVCGCPYGGSNWWSAMSKVGAGEGDEGTGVVRFREVSESYFDLLRVRDSEGRPLRPELSGRAGNLVLSSEMATKLYGTETALGKQLAFDPKNDAPISVCGVSSPIRPSRYEAADPCIFLVRRTDEELVRWVDDKHIYHMQCLVRFKEGAGEKAPDELFRVLGDSFAAGNFYVSCLYPLSEMRDEMLKNREDEHKKRASMVGFVLANIFFGIVGTFWLRTQSRRGEMGLRMAVGSSSGRLERLLLAEGLYLLLLTFPFLLAFVANLLVLDLLDTHRLAYTWWRFLLTVGGSYLLMTAMIAIGIWLPVRRAVRMAPAEALRYE